VHDQARLQQTLDGRSRLRGLEFTSTQWSTCSKVYRVLKGVRRILDDRGKMRPVSRTVLLAGVDCTSDGGTGCGRYCPMMYREEWLDLAEPPAEELAAPRAEAGFARIRPLHEIPGRLDRFGQREGLMFMPEMARYAGTRARILGQLSQVFEYDHWRAPPHPVYILDGLHCSGGILGSLGPCDRACRLLWHADWLEIEG
jgi:hypothetical protein